MRAFLTRVILANAVSESLEFLVYGSSAEREACVQRAQPLGMEMPPLPVGAIGHVKAPKSVVRRAALDARSILLSLDIGRDCLL